MLFDSRKEYEEAEEKQQLKITFDPAGMELRSFCMEDLDDFHATVQPERGYASGRLFDE